MVVDLLEKTDARQDKDYNQEQFKETVEPGKRNLGDSYGGLQVEELIRVTASGKKLYRGNGSERHSRTFDPRVPKIPRDKIRPFSRRCRIRQTFQVLCCRVSMAVISQ